MKIFSENNYFLLIFLFSIISFFLFIQLSLLNYIIPNFFSGDYSNIGLLDGDSVIHHHSTSYLAELLRQGEYKYYFIDFLDFTKIPVNIKLLSFFYAFIFNDPVVIIFLNLIFFLISILFIYKISRLISFNKTSFSIIFYCSSLILLFFPSYIYIFNSSGKESFVLPLLLIFLYYFINITNDKNYSLSYSNLSYLVLTISFLHILKPHFSYMLFIPSIFFLFFYSINLTKNKNQVLNLTVLISCMFLIYLFFSFVLQDFLKNFNHTEATTINEYIKDRIAGKHGPNIKEYILTFEYNKFIPDFIENKYFEILSLRNHFINYSISVGSESIIGREVFPNSIIKFILYSPKLILQSILVPFPWGVSESNNFFLVIAKIEMILVYFIILGLLLNIQHLRKTEIFIILICLFSCAILLFVNPNLGTFYRVRLPFMFILTILSINSWVFFIFTLFNNKIRNKTYSNDIKNFSLYQFIQNSYQNLFFLISFVSLVLLREIFLIKVIGINDNLSLYLITISFLGIIANSLNLPLNDTLITNRDENLQKLSVNSLKLIFSLFFILIILFFIFTIFSNDVPKIFKLDTNLSFPYYMTVACILISIPLNALSSSHLFIIRKNKISYFLQNIIPITSLLFILFFHNNLSLDLVYYSISLGVILNSILLFLYSVYHGLTLKIDSELRLKFLSFKNNQFLSLLKITLCFLLTNSYIIIIIYISSKISSNQFPVINIGLRFLLLINAIIASIVSAMVLPLFKKDNSLNLSSMKLILILFISICMVISFCSILLENFGTYTSFSDYLILIYILKILPLSILLNLMLKYCIHISKLNAFLFSGVTFSMIYVGILLFNNVNSFFEMINLLSFIFFTQMVFLMFFLKLNFISNLYFLLILITLIIFNFLDPIYFLLTILFLVFIFSFSIIISKQNLIKHNAN